MLAILGWWLVLRYGHLTVGRAECIVRLRDSFSFSPERLLAAQQCLAEAFELLLVDCETNRDKMLHACYAEDPQPSLLVHRVADWLEQHPDLVPNVAQRDRGYLVLARWNTNWGFFMAAEQCLDRLSQATSQGDIAWNMLRFAEQSIAPKKPDCAHCVQL